MKKVNFVGKIWLIFYVFTLFLTVVGAQAESSSTSTQTTSESTTTSSSSQSISQSSADSTSSSQSEDQSTSGTETDSSEIEESSDESENPSEENQNPTTFAGPLEDVSVATMDELKTALADTNVENITLTDDISLGTNTLPVNHSVVIDGDKGNGDRYTITYGSTLSRFNGISYGTDGITIHYKNLNFGKKSSLGSHDSTNAGNYFGIAPPGATTRTNRTLIIENVGYYSDYAAQPLYLDGSNDQIIFRGDNEFIMGGGSSSQEFAQANNITFDDDSTTNITDSNTLQTGFISSGTVSPQLKVGKSAKVNISTSHNIFATSNSTGSISVAEDGELLIKQTNSSRGAYFAANNKNLNIDLQAGANFEVENASPAGNRSVNITANLAENSSALFKATSGTTLMNGSSGTFNVDNTAKLVFEGTFAGVVRGTATINFSSFSADTTNYGVYTGSPSTLLLTQTSSSDSPWTVNNRTFSRSGDDFSSTDKTTLRNTTRLAIERETPVNLSWLSGSAQLSKDEPSIGGDFSDEFYYKDPNDGDALTFRIFDSSDNQVGSDITTTTPGDSDYHQMVYSIPGANLSTGTNNFTIKAYRTRDDGSKPQVGDTLNLTITVTPPALTLESVSSNLKWTNRTMTETQGILTRDSGNILEVKISDTRIDATDWYLYASVSGSAPFSLVWKKDASITTPVDLTSSNSEILRNTDVTKDEDNVYTKTWNEDLGVLLKSSNYLPINDYTGLLTISWNLYNVPVSN
ncbi:hypothetical protein OZX60_05580 [Streptococcaceae bacterium ESL0687]|nr:hypothetical protein OZX60_05580 [Streptococcaceae bacterium ESL0687]